jgi:hypothetical protein
MAKKSFRSGFDLKKMIMIAAVLVVVWVVFTSLKKEGMESVTDSAKTAMASLNNMVQNLNKKTVANSKANSK